MLATLLVMAVSLVAVMLVTEDFFDGFLTIIGILIIYPCVILGVYFYLEGKGYRWISGMDWSAMSDREKTNACSYIGFYLAIGCVLLGISIVCMLINFIIAIILMVVSIIIMLIPFVMQDRAKSKEFVERSTNAKIAVFLVFSLLAIVPMTVLGTSEFSQETVDVEFMDDKVHIQAPMFNYTFEYDKIEQLEMDPNFDKGTRIGGYATPTICSGAFSNGALGNYKLASYTQVKPCIFFLYEGKYYAFNQASAELTEQAFEMLKSKI